MPRLTTKQSTLCVFVQYKLELVSRRCYYCTVITRTESDTKVICVPEDNLSIVSLFETFVFLPRNTSEVQKVGGEGLVNYFTPLV